MTEPRPFLEQRGIVERWENHKRVDMKTWQIMIDLDDLWPTFTSPADMVSRLKPRREAHNAEYARTFQKDRGWFERIIWSPPQVVWYFLPSSKVPVAA